MLVWFTMVLHALEKAQKTPRRQKQIVKRRSFPACEAAEGNPDITSNEKASAWSPRTYFFPLYCEQRAL